MSDRLESPNPLPINSRRGASLRPAVIWSYSLIWGKLLITTALSFVLAALLGPHAFGVIAMALVFTGFVDMLQQQGLMPAIISRDELHDSHKDTAFWLVLGASLALTAAAILLAPWWASLNRLPELTQVIQVLSLYIPLSASVVVHEALLQRSLQFKLLAARTWLSVLAGGLAGIVAALLGWGVWALVAQQLIMAAVEVVVLWRVSSWRPRLRFETTAARDLWGYSVRSSISSMALYFGGRMGVLLGGVLFGPVAIGLYRMAERVTEVILSLTARGMQSVSLPGLAEVQDSREALKARLLLMQGRAACLALPLLGIVAATAPVVQQVLGDEWAGTTTVIRYLVIVQALRALTALFGPALQAVHRPGTLALLLWLFALLGAGSLLTASRAFQIRDETITLCAAMIFATSITSFLFTHVATRILHIRWTEMLRCWLPGVTAGLASGGTSYLLFDVLGGAPALIAALVAGIGGLAIGGTMILVLDSKLRHAFARRLPFQSVQDSPQGSSDVS